MTKFQETLDELFNEKLNFEYDGTALPTSEIDGNDNILNYSKEYVGYDTIILLVECKDRIIEFQKKLIKNQKVLFPNAHFLFVSNNGKVFDLYNNSTSKILKKITYDEIGRNTRLFKEKLQLFDVTHANDSTELQINAEKAFDTSDKITKKFFDKFKKIHDKLQKAITGIEDDKDKSWYASVMMNRIMFIYFLQKHYVIQGNTSFLLDKFEEVKSNGKDYYKDFLLPLFFYGFARRDNNPNKEEFVKQYGPIRYLNGGLFYAHHLEKKYTLDNATATVFEERALQTKIGIDSKLIKEILEFLDGYTWYLDNRPMKEDTDINPDVLGYIFEKYINQKELGAYYTKEDITEYISKNTIIPFILDKMKSNGFNAPDPNPMITNNEDIIEQMSNYVEGITNYKEVKFLYKDVLLELTVLDPSVGSGAFLFAALNILLPIYQKAVFKMKEFAKTQDDEWLHETILTLSHHAEEYYLTKQIILNNLYGVDIVEEATEICKLRLFLQLASHLPDITSIEPLPDIDFNIYAGNSLVGGLSWEDLEANYTMDLFTSMNRENIKLDIKTLSDFKNQYKTVQQQDENVEELSLLKDNIATLEHKINTDIKIGISNPFHWFIDFNTIIEKGGFDVIIGNPPYVEYSKKNKNSGKSTKESYQLYDYKSISCNNLYAYFFERSSKLLNNNKRLGFIVPLSISSAGKMSIVRKIINNKSSNVWVSHYSWRPSKLFSGADMLLSILLLNSKMIEDVNCNVYSTKYYKWYSEERDKLFNQIKYGKVVKFHNTDKYLKIENDIVIKILDKIHKHNNSISKYSNSGKYFLNYFRAVQYWIKILRKDPIMRNNGVDYSTTEMKKFHFNSEYERDMIGAILSSSTFFLHYIIFGSCQVINNDDFDFKIDIDKLDVKMKDELSNLGKQLFTDYEKNSELKVRIYKQKDTQEKQHFKIKLSKSIIDNIDKCLSKIYNFNEEEFDYIINYDFKYRMGADQEEED